jgi:hypothetical protein
MELEPYAAQLEELGHTVTSRLRAEQFPDTRDLARAHLDDLRTSDAVVAFTDTELVAAPGARHVELGVAIAANKRIFVIGQAEHVFHALADNYLFSTFDDFFVWIKMNTARYGINETVIQTMIDRINRLTADEVQFVSQQTTDVEFRKLAQMRLIDNEYAWCDNIWHDVVTGFTRAAKNTGTYGNHTINGAVLLAINVLAEALRDSISEEEYRLFTGTYRLIEAKLQIA